MLFLPGNEMKMKASKISKKIDIEKKPEEWEEVYGTNCYAYALGLDVCELDITRFAYQPGTIGRITYKRDLLRVSSMSFEGRMRLDFRALGIRCVEATPEECASYKEYYHKDSDEVSSVTHSWLISFYKAESNNVDFHFVRKDLSGVWTHKMGFSKSPTTKDTEGNIILDPRKCNFRGFRYVKTYRLTLNQGK